MRDIIILIVIFVMIMTGIYFDYIFEFDNSTYGFIL